MASFGGIFVGPNWKSIICTIGWKPAIMLDTLQKLDSLHDLVQNVSSVETGEFCCRLVHFKGEIFYNLIIFAFSLALKYWKIQRYSFKNIS